MSQTKIYVGSLSYDTTKEDLIKYFSKFGKIEGVNLIVDRETGRSKGFAFIEFDSQKSAQDSLQESGKNFMGKGIKVSIAKDKRDNNNRGRYYR